MALEAMLYNLERELAFTTRTIEYLWCGLPVLYNDYGEVSEHIREYDAGWTVDPESDEQLAAALEEIFCEPEAVRRKSQNAQRLVRERFTWDRTIEPLLDFLRHPSRAPAVEPVPAPIPPPPAYLVPGATRSTCLSSHLSPGSSNPSSCPPTSTPRLGPRRLHRGRAAATSRLTLRLS